MSERNIYQRIHAVMTDVERISKEGYNPHHRYNFIGHDDVTQAVRRAFVRHGIVQRVTLVTAERTVADMIAAQVQVEWINIDQPDDRVVVECYGESQIGGKGGPSPQQIGVAISYAVKVAMLKNFCLVGDDTADAEMQHTAAAAPARQTMPDDSPALALAVKELELAETPEAARKALAVLVRYKDVISPDLSERIGELAAQKLQ